MGEKTEAPTPRKLADARAEGQVAKSQELAGAAVLLVGVWMLQSVGGKLIDELKLLLSTAASNTSVDVTSGAWLRSLLADNVLVIAPGLGLLLVCILLTGVTVNVAQTGLLWAQKRLGFHFDRLNLFKGLKRMFSSQGLVELVKNLFKLLVVGLVGYSFLKARAGDVLLLGQMDLASAVSAWTALGIALAMRVGAAYLTLALVDYAYQRWTVMKSLRMSKEEIKEDFKSSEGDPFIRSRIRGQQRRMARMRMMSNVKKADVIITNPTHLAVAVQYNAQDMNAPKVVAKGADRVAERIKALGREHHIPIVQNVPVARALYRAVDIDDEIPPELYVALAEVLAYVYRMRGQSYRPAAA
jgi:flagellar biosynthetic protein FlhB